jgi:hypothetical protein
VIYTSAGGYAAFPIKVKLTLTAVVKASALTYSPHSAFCDLRLAKSEWRIAKGAR